MYAYLASLRMIAIASRVLMVTGQVPGRQGTNAKQNGSEREDARAAAVLALVVTTSLAMVYARTLSYLLKVVMAAVYSSSRLVVHAGEDRSMEPLRGSAISSLHVSPAERCSR